MVSLTAPYSSPTFTPSHPPTSSFNLPVVFLLNPKKIQRHLRQNRRPVNRNSLFFEFSDRCGVVGVCGKWGVEGDPALELQVLEYMKNSKTPEKFPSKRELVEDGRGDLVEAILKRGGWMSIGWEDENTESKENDYGSAEKWEFEYGTKGENDLEGISIPGSSSLATSSSTPSLEITAEDEGGIEGILHRLKRQRGLSFGLDTRKKGGFDHTFRNSNNEGRSGGMSKGCGFYAERSNTAPLGYDEPLPNGLIRSHSDVSGSSLSMEAQRIRGFRRADFSDAEFEDREIDFGGNTDKKTMNNYMGDIVAVPTDFRETLDRRKDLQSVDVRSRLRNLEVELSSVLCSLKSNPADLSEKTKEHLFEDIRQLSDASEFQENEIMKKQGKLRSLRAKLAILEGKMTLAIIDAQKILDEKQKRMNDVCRALRLLRTTCLVWPNSGSEVFVAGSFDGWATQRKMKRLRGGIFSLQLKLYPGKYEIKFIVDGSWKVDPLRPIVNNNGFENNLLIIT